jgi:hypothetical protein
MGNYIYVSPKLSRDFYTNYLTGNNIMLKDSGIEYIDLERSSYVVPN